jgi:hypothetical protein
MPRKILVLFAIVIVGLVAVFGVTPLAKANNDRPPTEGQVEFAKTVSDLMLNELLAALGTEFDETTPENVEHGKQAISLVFNDHNRDMRLVGVFRPLLGGGNNRPSDPFETAALRLALSGQAYTDVEEVNDTWYYRRSVPLSNTFHVNCVLCHSNFTKEFFDSTKNPGQWVGSLMLRVPIRTNRN